MNIAMMPSMGLALAPQMPPLDVDKCNDNRNNKNAGSSLCQNYVSLRSLHCVRMLDHASVDDVDTQAVLRQLYPRPTFLSPSAGCCRHRIRVASACMRAPRAVVSCPCLASLRLPLTMRQIEASYLVLEISGRAECCSSLHMHYETQHTM